LANAQGTISANADQPTNVQLLQTREDTIHQFAGQPPRKPIGSQPRLAAALATARITAFRPGQSPPPVTIPMRSLMDSLQFSLLFCQRIANDVAGVRRKWLASRRCALTVSGDDLFRSHTAKRDHPRETSSRSPVAGRPDR
jgi:hypothetical protein